MKHCNKCNRNLTLDKFYRDKKSPDGRTWYCAECQKALAKEWNLKNKERHIARVTEWAKNNPERKKRYMADYRKKNRPLLREQSYDYYLKHKREIDAKSHQRFIRQYYNMHIEQYEEMFKNQNGACAICSKQNLNGRRLSVDHDHKTGTIRGLLCNHCNMAIGQFGDNVETMQKAIEYLTVRV